MYMTCARAEAEEAFRVVQKRGISQSSRERWHQVGESGPEGCLEEVIPTLVSRTRGVRQADGSAAAL